MTPMNLVSEIAQPISMAFRHFGNIAGGNVLTSLVYSALATASAALLGLVGKSIAVGILILLGGVALLVLGVRKKSWLTKFLVRCLPQPEFCPCWAWQGCRIWKSAFPAS